MIACSQEHCAVIECSCVLVCVYLCVCVRMLILILACGAGGLQVSNSSAIFRGHISSAVRSPGVCQSESLPLPVPCPYPSNTSGPPPPPHVLPLRAASSSRHAVSPLCLLAYLVPAVLPARPLNLSLSPTGSGQGWAALAGRGWGEGGEQGRGHCQCYFEPLTGAASERRLLALGCSGPGHAGECPSDPPPRKCPRLLTLSPHLGKEGPFCRFPRCD